MAEPESAEQLRAAAADPQTPLAMLADIAYAHESLRPVIAANPSTYDGLLEWLRELGDPEVTAALDARARGIVDDPEPGVLRITQAPGNDVGSGPIVLSAAEPTVPLPTTPPEPQRVKPRRPAFLSNRFLLVAAGIVVLAIIVIVVAVSAHNAALQAQAAADYKAQQEAADKANAASGTGSSPKSHASPSPTRSALPEPTPTPRPPVANGTGNWEFASSTGYTYTETVTLAPGVQYDSKHPTISMFGTSEKAGLACEIDSSTDLIVPVQWLATATTTKFSTPVTMDLTITAPQDTNVMVEQFFSGNQTSCWSSSFGAVQANGPAGELQVSFNGAMKEGTETWQPLFVIVKNYFSPSYPSGDTDLLAGIVLRPDSSVASDSDQQPYLDTAGDGAAGYVSNGMNLAGQEVVGQS